MNIPIILIESGTLQYIPESFKKLIFKELVLTINFLEMYFI